MADFNSVSGSRKRSFVARSKNSKLNLRAFRASHPEARNARFLFFPDAPDAAQKEAGTSAPEAAPAARRGVKDEAAPCGLATQTHPHEARGSRRRDFGR